MLLGRLSFLTIHRPYLPAHLYMPLPPHAHYIHQSTMYMLHTQYAHVPVKHMPTASSHEPVGPLPPWEMLLSALRMLAQGLWMTVNKRSSHSQQRLSYPQTVSTRVPLQPLTCQGECRNGAVPVMNNSTPVNCTPSPEPLAMEFSHHPFLSEIKQ